jgi:hypothetical protein
MERGGSAGGGISRRTFVRRAGLLGAALAATDLGALLDANGWLEKAQAQSPDLTVHTLSGLVAMMAPGDDAYSAAQGDQANGPGGIAAGAVEALMNGVDHYIPLTAIPGNKAAGVPASSAVATLLDGYAMRVNAASAVGPFPSSFANLKLAEKVEVYRQLEADAGAQGTEFSFVAGILPGFAAFLGYSETGVRDVATGELKGRAIGWDIAHYDGPADGRDELIGYWHGHVRARQTPRRRKPHKPRKHRPDRRRRRRRR